MATFRPSNDAPRTVAERVTEPVRDYRVGGPLHTEALAFVRSYTGTFGLIRDIRARGIVRLSPRQVDVILASRDRDEERAAAAYAASVNGVRARWGSEPVTPGALPAATEPGFYSVGADIWRVRQTKDGQRTYAVRLDVQPGARKGTWEYVKGGLNVIARDGAPLTEAAASAFGLAHGICAICAAELSDPISVARGIGPVCAKKVQR
jgi:hypothetical protein